MRRDTIFRITSMTKRRRMILVEECKWTIEHDREGEG
jgi:hypothetical protein